MVHLDVPEVLIILGVAGWIGLAMYNWKLYRHHHHHPPRLPHR
jgi:hypothetical protein